MMLELHISTVTLIVIAAFYLGVVFGVGGGR
jgi:hypothetical protein